MALDHYVPQVHLRQFASKTNRGLLNAIRKRDGVMFSPRTQDVCRIDEGNTNPYLQEPRAIEEFLKTIEPRYNGAVDALRAGSTDEAAFDVVAGFVAYVATCSPAAMRINSEPPRSAVELTTEIMEARGKLPPMPESVAEKLGSTSMTDLIRNGAVQINVDPKFPQSFGINQIQALQSTFRRATWELLHNGVDGSPFVTSDFPVAIEPTPDPRVIARLVPLARDLAARVVPRIPSPKTDESAEQSNGARRHRDLGRREVARVNKTLVRCAEDAVFYPDEASWAPKLVMRNNRYRVAPRTRRIPTERGSLLWFSLTIAEANDRPDT